MLKINKWISDILKETGNDTIDISRIMAVIAFVSYLGYAGFGLYKDHFDLNTFATGLLQVLLGAGGIVGIKQATTKSS